MAIKYHMFFLFLGFVLISFENVSSSFKDVMVTKGQGAVVTTQSGKVMGTLDTFNLLQDLKTHNFLGIPYAKAPVGDLRFKKPQPMRAWEDVYNATKYPKSCPQTISKDPRLAAWSVEEISEDCLYLNVFLPKELDADADHAVMVWIHGGGFNSGSSTLDVYDARYLAISTGTIVVSMNYRLGAFGFLSLESKSMSSNVGLYDQSRALAWVRKNIAAFGGNRNKVTIFGESAGAVSVGLHLLSNKSQNKFNQAILQSGSALNPWAVVPLEEARRRSKDLASKVGCDQSLDKEIVTCMKCVSIEKILEHQDTVVLGLLQFSFSPTIDGEFLEDCPQKLLAKGDFKKHAILAGSNKDEANFFLVFSLAEFLDPTNPHMNSTDFTRALMQSFYTYPLYPKPLSQEGQTAILNQYSPPTEYRENMLANFNAINMAVTDSGFICPLNKFLSAYSKLEPKVYSYLFTQELKNELIPEGLGVPHAIELLYTFSSVIKYGSNLKFTPLDIALSKQIIQMWGNFAKTSDPNGELTYPVWPAYTADAQTYLELNAKYIGSEESATGKGPRDGFCDFWNEEILKFYSN